MSLLLLFGRTPDNGKAIAALFAAAPDKVAYSDLGQVIASGASTILGEWSGVGPITLDTASVAKAGETSAATELLRKADSGNAAAVNAGCAFAAAKFVDAVPIRISEIAAAWDTILVPPFYLDTGRVYSAQVAGAVERTSLADVGLVFAADSAAGAAESFLQPFFDSGAARAAPTAKSADQLRHTASSNATAGLIARSYDVAPSPSPLAVYALDDIFLALRLFAVNYGGLIGTTMIEPYALLPILDAFDRAVDAQQTALQLAANSLADPTAGIAVKLVGDNGVSGSIYGCGDEGFIDAMAPQTDVVLAVGSTFTPVDTAIKSQYGNWWAQLNNYLSKQGYASLDSYAGWANSPSTGSLYSFLVGPGAAYLQYLFANKLLLMSPSNVAAPVVEFGTITVGPAAGQIGYAQNIVSGSPASILTVNNLPDGLQGYTPAKSVQAAVTTAINGTLTLDITADGWDSNGNVVTGRAWTLVLSNATLNSVISATPANSGDRISAISAIVAAGGGTATAGAVTLNSQDERSGL